MAKAFREDQITPADELRELLMECEMLVVNLRGRGRDAVDLLRKMDRLQQLWPKLEAAGMDLRPEAGRWETLEASLHKHGPALLRELQGSGGLPAARARDQVSEPQERALYVSAWWWHLDEEVRARRLKSVRTAVLAVLGVVAAGALVIFLFNKLFPVDPMVQKSMSSMLAGQQIIEQGGDIQSALPDFEQATRFTPDDIDSWMWLGALQQKLAKTPEADESFRRARALVNSDVAFWTKRAPVYIALGMLQEAQSDLDAAIAADPQNPEAQFHLASLLEAQGQIDQAVAALEKASQYAEARQMTELTAIARYRMAMMMQQGQAPSFATATPTPAP